MSFQKTGGFAAFAFAFAFAATYLFGFALLVTLLAPLGFGTGETDVAAAARLEPATPGWAAVTRGFGLI